MPLTAAAICKAVAAGDIVIEPFNLDQLNPNSYNVCLGDELGVYLPVNTPDMINTFDQCLAIGGELPKARLDCRADNPLHYFKMAECGVLLHPGKLYLGSTVEFTDIPKHVAVIDGRSSLARLGVKTHITGGFGDIGFRGHWTLEIEVTEPVRIYPFMQFAQIRFHVPYGDITMTYQGKYRDQVRPIPCRLHQEMTDDSGPNDTVEGALSVDTPVDES